jgi:hypothetical protein
MNTALRVRSCGNAVFLSPTNICTTMLRYFFPVSAVVMVWQCTAGQTGTYRHCHGGDVHTVRWKSLVRPVLQWARLVIGHN